MSDQLMEAYDEMVVKLQAVEAQRDALVAVIEREGAKLQRVAEAARDLLSREDVPKVLKGTSEGQS